MDAGNLLEKAAGNLSVRRAFGTAYEKDGMLIIPVAIVAGGGGAGTARARRGNLAGPDGLAEEDSAAHDAAPQAPGQMDAGGGFGGLVLPAGVYVVKGDQVPLGTCRGCDDRRAGVAEPGVGARPYLGSPARAGPVTLSRRSHERYKLR